MAERFSEAAIRVGSLSVNTPLSSVSASLRCVTRLDQRRPVRFDPRLRRPPGLDLRGYFAAVAFFLVRAIRV